MNPTSPATRTGVAGKKIAVRLESRVREVGSFLLIVEQNTLQIFDNLQRNPKKTIYLKFVKTVLRNRAGANVGALAPAYPLQ
jgi:hypothetical protein